MKFIDERDLRKSDQKSRAFYDKCLYNSGNDFVTQRLFAATGDSRFSGVTSNAI